MTRFLPLLLHIRTKLLAKTAANETVKVLVEDCPERTPSSAIALHFAEYNGRAKYVSDGVHPCLLVAFEVGINNGDEVI
jgi:hypothetical protein